MNGVHDMVHNGVSLGSHSTWKNYCIPGKPKINREILRFLIKILKNGMKSWKMQSFH